jgi:hypothetical protein
MDEHFERKWNKVVDFVSQPYGERLEIDAILFLIGVQELGQGYRKFTKDQKLDVLHIAICTLLSKFGYYVFAGRDKDGWPHYEATEKLPYLKPMQQNLLMRQAIVEYFSEDEELESADSNG